jgi:hypothetical protein
MQMQCGVDILLSFKLGSLPAEGLQLAAPAERGQKNANITLVAGPGLASHAAALAAWQSAVAIWESWLLDPVSLRIEGDLVNLPQNILGSTTSRAFGNNYRTIRNAISNDAGDDEELLAGLPFLSQLSLLMPAGFSFPDQMIATKANLKALGFDMSFDQHFSDAEIEFSLGFLPHFDFDPSDGIDADKIDFEAVVVHEIGHALGFGSAVDIVDHQRSIDQPVPVPIYPLDLFRLEPGEGVADFTNSARVITTGDQVQVQMFFDGVNDLQMSTGVDFGDGRQASHWKDDQQTGVAIGIMDPTLSPGSREELREADLRAFGLIGWDVAAEPTEPPPDPPDEPPPSPFQITSAYPNPFNPRVTVEFTVEFNVPVAAEVRLDIYDLRGRLVRRMDSQVFAAGEHTTSWDGTTEDGGRVGSGVYFMRLLTGLGAESRKVVLVK